MEWSGVESNGVESNGMEWTIIYRLEYLSLD
jgi:hypothetical protein